jgi:hypothetical protein
MTDKKRIRKSECGMWNDRAKGKEHSVNANAAGFFLRKEIIAYPGKV